MGKTVIRKMLYNTSNEYLPEISSDYLDEMEAIAKNAGLGFADILLLNVINKVGVRMSRFLCTSLAINQTNTTDNSLWHAYNTDIYLPLNGKNYLDSYKGLIFYHPDKENSFVTANTCGYSGIFCGMNDKGISVSLVHPLIGKAEKGMPIRFLLRSVLQKARGLSEAVEMIKSTQRTIPAQITVADGNTNEAVTVSFTPGKPECKIKKMKDGRLVTGRGEVEFTSFLSARKNNPCSVTDITGFLRYKPDDWSGICSQETSFSLVFHPASRRFWVALGKTPAPLSDFYGFDLRTEKIITRKP